MAIDFRADSVGQRVKGWVPRGQNKVKLVPGWEPRPEYGAGQGPDDNPDLNPFDPGSPPPTPPAPEPAPAPAAPPPDPGLQAHLGGSPLPTPPPPSPAPAPPKPAPTDTPPVDSAGAPPTQPVPKLQPPAPAPTPSPASAPQGAAAQPKPQQTATQRGQAAVANSPAGRTTSQQTFIQTMLPTAQKVSMDTGIPWQVLVAIPANETGWGQAVFHNNYFGVKDPKGAPARTWEMVNGQRQDITDNFASYSDAEASMRGFSQFLNDNPRYSQALSYVRQNPQDWPTFVNMLKSAGYATDDDWASKVIHIGQGVESPSTQPLDTVSQKESSDTLRGQGGVLDFAKTAIGSKYVWGGPGGRSNFDQNFVGSDCSGYVSWVYRNALGVNLPAQTSAIWSTSTPISQDQAKPGDLVMYNHGQGPEMEHVGIYEGGGMMIHDSSINPDGGVDETPLWDGAVFRRVNGVNPDDLTKSTQANQSPPGQVDAGSVLPHSVAPIPPQDTGPPGTPLQAEGDLKPEGQLGTGQESDDGEDDTDYSFLDTPLSPAGEGAFQQWKSKYAPKDSGWDYDLRGAYAAGLKPDPQSGHWPDTYKKPNHPTFSDQSKFAKDYPSRAGHWDGDTYMKASFLNPSTGNYDPLKPSVGAGQMGAGDDWSSDPSLNTQVDQPAPQQDDTPWWQKAKDTAAGAVEGATTAVTSAAQNVQTSAGDIFTKATSPVSSQPAPDLGSQTPSPETPSAPDQPSTGDIRDTPVVGGVIGALAPTGQHQLAVGESIPASQVPGQGLDPSHMGRTASTDLGVRQDQPQTFPDPVGEGLRAQRQSDVTQTAAEAGALTASLAVAPVAGAVAGGGLAASIGGHAVIGAVSAGVAQAPQIAKDIATGDTEDLKTQAGIVAAGAILPYAGKAAGLAGKGISKVAGPAAEVLGDLAGKAATGAVDNPAARAAYDAVKPLVTQLSDSPFGKFILEDSGAVLNNAAVKQARNVIKGSVMGAVGGAGLAAWGDRDMQRDDPDWWAKFTSDVAAGAKTGAEFGGALAVSLPMIEYGWNKTVGEGTMRYWRGVMEPLKNIPSAPAQDVLLNRANMLNKAEAGTQLLDMEAQRLFPPHGTGVNTADAAAYVEENRTLQGYVGPGGETPTSDQIKWVNKRVIYEDATGDEMRRLGILQPWQDVRTPVGAPGPSTHIIHMYEPDPATASSTRRGKSFGWDDTVTHKRMESGDVADPTRPRTIAEAQTMHNAYPIDNPKPLDSLTKRYTTSFAQSERSMANRRAWVTLRGDPTVVQRPQPGRPPNPDWVKVKGEWGMGAGQEQYRVHPDLAKYFDNVSGVSQGLRDKPLFDALTALNTPMKMMAFSSTPVHIANVAWRVYSLTAQHGVLGNGVGELARNWILPTFKPGGLKNLFLANANKVLDAADAGVTLSHFGDDAVQAAKTPAEIAVRMGAAGMTSASAGYLDAKRRGATEQEAWDEAWKWGAAGAAVFTPGAGAALKGTVKAFGHDVSQPAAASLADLIHGAIFTQAMPAAKVGLYDMLTRTGADRHVVADMVNNTLGGIDMLKIGRSPAVQDLMRFGLVASDWEEGQVRTLWNAFSGDAAGSFTRRTFVQGMASMYGTTELLNLALNGHFTWDNGTGHEFELETTGALDKIAALTGNPGASSQDPANGRPQRTYMDVMPPLRWMMQTLGEGTRQLAIEQGQAEQGMGMTDQGQRLVAGASGDISKGEVPPDFGQTLRTDMSQRIGFPVLALGNVANAVSGNLTDWTGKPLTPPGAEPPNGWMRLASVLAPDAPSGPISVMRDLNVEHPDRARVGDAALAALGVTRTYTDKAVADALNQKEVLLQHLGYSPAQQDAAETAHQNNLARNDAKKADAFTSAENGTQTHAQIDTQLQTLSKERGAFSRREEILTDFLGGIKDKAQQDKTLNFLLNVWDPGEAASKRGADLGNNTDAQPIADAYWNPPNVDPKDKQGINYARNTVLSDMAERTGESPDAIHDALKWNRDHADPNTGQGSSPPLLPGMSSDKLSQAVTGFLDAGYQKDNPSALIDDPGERADARRAYLDQVASQNPGVDSGTLLQRINLRLESDDQPVGLEKSYNNALQTFFDSRDTTKHPEYLNPDGTPLGTPDDWKAWDKELAGVPLDQRQYLSQYRTRYLAQKAGTDARKKSLMNAADNPDYERWFGTGRNMTDAQWRQYASGNMVGYTDLKKEPDAPKNETIRRDKILKLYDASSDEERFKTTVTVYLDGGLRKMGLGQAYQLLHNKNVYINTAGRTMDDSQASDDAGADQGVQ